MLSRRPWVPAPSEDLVQRIAAETAGGTVPALDAELHRLVEDNHRIHDREGINLNPASNVMNPRAEALMAAGLGPRASLGWPGDKYEMGLQAIERIEVIAAELAAGGFAAGLGSVHFVSGMVLLGPITFMVLGMHGPAGMTGNALLRTLLMVLYMNVGMGAWMRYRGHYRRRCPSAW